MTLGPETTLATDVDPEAEANDTSRPDAESEVEVHELLVEEVSIDGLCGVY